LRSIETARRTLRRGGRRGTDPSSPNPVRRGMTNPAPPAARPSRYDGRSDSAGVHREGKPMPHVHAPGLVLRFDPKTLAKQGATYTGKDDEELSPQQYFLCIDANPKDALWVPLFAASSPGRKGILPTAKTGHSRWIRYSSFYDAAQICRIAHKSAHLASVAAFDESSPKVPNRLAVASVPARSEFPPDEAFRPMSANTAFR
jgi:hypothetical protein